MNQYLIALLCSVLASSHLLQFSETQPHNKDCYSQGLFFLNSSHIFESCGWYGRSYFHILQYSSNPFMIKEVMRSKTFDKSIFLEGAVEFNGLVYIMTWRQHIVFKLDPKNNFQQVEILKWKKDGWGLTTNKTHMFATDGSNKIYLVDKDFNLLESKIIKDETGRNVYSINELQYVDGYIYANIYFQNYIVKINYEKGKVVDQFDGSALIKNEKGLKSDQVFNGIAYNTENDKFVLTGKDWSHFYEVQL